MLPRPSRLHRRTEFTHTARRGRRAASPGVVVHVHVDPVGGKPKAGFVVGRVVGPAVVRNRVRRRLRHLVAARLGSLPPGSQLVVRATGEAAALSFAALGDSLDAALPRALPGASR